MEQNVKTKSARRSDMQNDIIYTWRTLYVVFVSLVENVIKYLMFSNKIQSVLYAGVIIFEIIYVACINEWTLYAF